MKSLKYYILFAALFFVKYESDASVSQVSKPVFNIFAHSVQLGTEEYKIFDWQKLFETRRGGSFGRSRSSGTRSRSSQQSSARSQTRTQTANPQKQPSFGGQRLDRQQATARYGAPRRTETVQSSNAAGGTMDYRMNHYGGFSSSLMTGYMLGNMAWWMTAPALLYSRPYYVENEDGTVDVYPPTFNWGRLFFILLVVFGVIYFIRFMRAVSRAQAVNEKRTYSSFG
jgi:hypothetical protein